jgi:hypothetical protein
MNSPAKNKSAPLSEFPDELGYKVALPRTRPRISGLRMPNSPQAGF